MPEEFENSEEPKSENKTTRGLAIASVAESWRFKGQNYLYTIGIDQYKYWTPLKNAVKDVQDFAAILMNHYQFDKDHHFALLNEEATLKNILKYFRELFQIITPEDNLVIYFSGHGHYDEPTKTGYWIPREANEGIEYEHEFINTAIIFDKLKNINSLHTFLLIDACFSGALLYRNKSKPRPEQYKSRLVFASGREVVSDGAEGDNSPFAKAIIRGLTRNTDKYISASELVVEVKKVVNNNTKQTPIDSRLINSGDEGGDFIFHLKMSEAEVWAKTISLNTKEMYKKFMERFPQSAHYQEAQEAYDWLMAHQGNNIQSILRYLNRYQPHGKHVPLAIKTLENLEEEERWKKAKAEGTYASYYNYLQRYPTGKYVAEAKEKINQLAGDEDAKAWEIAKLEHTEAAYLAYITEYPDGRHVDEANDIIHKLPGQRTWRGDTDSDRIVLPPADPIKPTPEHQAWEKAKNANTYIAYHDFLLAHPDSRFVEEAQKIMQEKDDIALNRIKIMAASKTLSLKEKIRQCIRYFDEFPGADNNIYVKQIKDQLEIRGR